MLQPKKKISKKEIKHDELVTRAMQAEAWALKNQKILSYAGIGLVVLIVGFFVWRDRTRSAEEEATTRLAAILSVYDQGNVQQAIDGVPSEGKFGLKSIVDEHGGTAAGTLAKLYLANALVTQRKYAEALDVFEDIGGSDKLVASSSLAGQGVCLEALGRYEEAAKAFERAASTDPKNPLAPDRLLSAATNASRAGDKVQAREILATLKKQYPTSTVAREFDRFEAQLGS